MIESVLAFFAVFLVLGTAWFWVAAVGLFILILALEENDCHFWAGLTLLAFVFLMEKSGAVSIFTSPLTVLYWGAIYMALGAGWSFVKWFSFLHQKSDKLQTLKLLWLEKRNSGSDNRGFRETEPETITPLAVDVATKIPKEEMSAYREYLYKQGFINSESAPLIPQIGDSKSRAIAWIVWWPWSALWTILNDPIRRIATAIYNQLQTTYQALANRVFAKFAVDED